MPISGKYDFPGIKKLNAVGIKAALASWPYTAWILKGGKLTDLFLEFIGNLLANQGLIIMNVGAVFVEGHFDQQGFDKAIDEGLEKVELGRSKLTPEQGKAIDDAVINAARKFIPYTRKR